MKSTKVAVLHDGEFDESTDIYNLCDEDIIKYAKIKEDDSKESVSGVYTLQEFRELFNNECISPYSSIIIFFN